MDWPCVGVAKKKCSDFWTFRFCGWPVGSHASASRRCCLCAASSGPLVISQGRNRKTAVPSLLLAR